MFAISQKLFNDLLHEKPPTEAVFALSDFWRHRLDGQARYFGLSRPEYRVQLILIYTGEVGNGGHSQYFENRGTRFLADTISALETVGFQEMADVLSQAASKEASLDASDQAAWKLSGRMESVLMEYIRAHANEVLAPERSRY